jgi:CRISPR-associated protein Cmr3
MIGLSLHPMDTLFFRSGMPFDAGGLSLNDAGGVFPPPPPTIAGAIRATLARSRGWSGNGSWGEDVAAVLGDGPEHLGQLHLTGPFLLRDGAPLFAMPRHLLGEITEKGWMPRLLLHPGPKVSCDLGESVRLPEMPVCDQEAAEYKSGEGWWLTQVGLNALVRGDLPPSDAVVPSHELWAEERRIGLTRNQITRTAEEGLLYSTRHVRPTRGVSLGVLLHGLPGDWSCPTGECFLLGGEGRMVEGREWETRPEVHPPWDRIRADGRFALIAITPLRLPHGVFEGRSPLEGFGRARVVSACAERPARIGGWDSLNRRPLQQRSVLPAGSVLFCQADTPSDLAEPRDAIGGLCGVGEGQAAGFGRVAVGTWKEERR